MGESPSFTGLLPMKAFGGVVGMVDGGEGFLVLATSETISQLGTSA